MSLFLLFVLEDVLVEVLEDVLVLEEVLVLALGDALFITKNEFWTTVITVFSFI